MTTALCPLGRSTKSPKFRPQFRPTMGRFFRGLQVLVVEEVSLCRWRKLLGDSGLQQKIGQAGSS